MNTLDTLFSDITVLTMDEQNPVLKGGFVGVSGRAISYVGAVPPAEKATRVINGARRLLMPGLINAHTHLPMTLLRGYADDYRLQEWLFDHIFPAESRLDARCIAAGVRLGLAECIQFGVVSCTDMYFHLSSIADAVLEAGTKANITNGVLCLDMSRFDFEKERGTMEVRELLVRYGGARSGDGRLVIDAGIHAEYTSGPAAWQASAEFAAENNLRLHLHLSETAAEYSACVAKYGKTPA
ncbi:MAG: amidohydrolase family protein, partial [Treponema sp.]|nr:amidohydrolase family protein [Treponema sp.]